MMRIPELLAPAGGLEQLYTALRFGADAVYCGLRAYGLRAFAGNFDWDMLCEGVAAAHALRRKLYVTLNAFAWDEELEGIAEAGKRLAGMGVDAAIVSDPGVVATLREAAPTLALHLSTQANTTNARAAAFWHALGISRVILAREVPLERVAHMRGALPETLSLEAFVHGAMCMAYSGRCLLSDRYTGRAANRGACTQPCRWHYTLLPDQHETLPLTCFEDARGSYLLSAQDLCMIAHIPALCASGIDSLKIEGRMKNAYYVATIVGAYRRALDAYAAGPARYEALLPEIMAEVEKVSHRAYDTGFYFGSPPSMGGGGREQTAELIAQVLGYDVASHTALLLSKNRFFAGDTAEALTPAGTHAFEVADMTLAETGEPMRVCNQPETRVYVRVPSPLAPGDFVRGVNRTHRRDNMRESP